jgi:hypothetical protein
MAEDKLRTFCPQLCLWTNFIVGSQFVFNDNKDNLSDKHQPIDLF